MWSPKQKIYNLARSLRRARSVSLPLDNDAAIKILLPMVFGNMYRSLNELLENSEFDINYKYGTVERTLLHIASNTGFSESLIVILKRKADPNIQDIAGHTPLHIAARNGFKVCVEKLLEHGADPNIAGTDGATVLHWASVNGRYEIMSLILKNITNINAQDSQGNTALHSAARNGHVKVMEGLINAGADINHLNKFQQTSLHAACSTGQRNSIELLLTKNPTISPDNANLTPLALCLQGGYGVAATLLLTNSINSDNSFDNVVSTFIELAVFRSDFDIKRVCRCLMTLESQPICDIIGDKLCKLICDIGLQLLSISTHLHTTSKHLLKAVEILKNFVKPKELRHDSSGRPIPIPSHTCLNSFLPLWKSVNNWFILLQQQQTELHTNDSDVDLLPKMSERLSVLVSVLYTSSLLTNEERFENNQSSWLSRVTANNHLQPLPYPWICQFSEFIERHVDVLKIIVSEKPDIIFNYFRFLLDNHRLMKPFLNVVKSQPFKKRYEWFYEHLKATTITSADKITPIQIKRADVFADSCRAVEKLNAQVLRTGFSIQFQGEEGMGEGVTREWFNVLLAEIVNPEYGLFSQSADGCTFQPNSQSAVNPDHLTYFKFAGRILGLAMFHRQLVDVRFTRSFYKHLLAIKVNYDDVASIDSEYAKNLQWILDNDITDMGLSLTFLIETDVFGAMQEIELKSNGSQISVTESNKAEYVQLVTELRMTGAIRPQIDGFLCGFYEVIPAKYLQLFSEDELDYMLAGSSQITVEQWKSITEYYGEFDHNHQTVKCFWRCVDEMDNKQRTSLLHFTTGRTRMPPTNFSYHSFNFVLMPSGLDKSRLPTASTCMNMLKLPLYDDFEEMQQSLATVIECGIYGYTFS